MVSQSRVAKASIRVLLSLYIATLSLMAMAQDPDVITVGNGGFPANCTASSLQQAINLAAQQVGPSRIWVSRNTNGGQYSNQNLKINNQDLQIIGGFDNCFDTTPSGQTTISGAGGATDSVIEIRGSGVVRLTNLYITGGDEDASGDGGGIDYKGRGELVLQNTTLIQNQAGYGGGLYFASSGGPAFLTILDSVLFLFNTAINNGGGMHVSGDTRMTMISDNNGVVGNTAGDVGGGLYLKAPADADIGAGKMGAIGGLFWQNDAARGGAIGTYGGSGYSRLRLFTAIATKPMTLSDNESSVSGGALYMSPTNTLGGGASSVEACLWDVSMDKNRAPQGAAIYAAEELNGIRWELNPSLATGFCGDDRPPEAVNCAGASCSEISNNRTVTTTGTPTDGAIVWTADRSQPYYAMNRFSLRGNIAGTLVKYNGGDGPISRISNCLVHSNTTSSFLFDLSDQRTHVHHCTVANNLIGGSAAIRIRRGSLSNSIFRLLPGEDTVLRTGSNPADFQVAYVFSNELNSLPVSATITSADPGMINPNNPPALDFRLRANANAIDFAPPSFPNSDGTGAIPDELLFDLDGQQRNRDLPPMNVGGARDAGAFERQTVPSDPIFGNGFE